MKQRTTPKRRLLALNLALVLLCSLSYRFRREQRAAIS